MVRMGENTRVDEVLSLIDGKWEELRAPGYDCGKVSEIIDLNLELDSLRRMAEKAVWGGSDETASGFRLGADSTSLRGGSQGGSAENLPQAKGGESKAKKK